MSRVTPLPESDAATSRAADDLVITEFGHETGEFPDGRICICWASPGSPSATIGGRPSR
ncbi:hypothetical protein OG562_37925 [Streptomyces sp. NBC_01275]|uniref:hypothetical protein n=1 Tax=Streptomyces sp. NBC_01275 TaxID=2903807 RepID=UPI0022575FF0|nr:hypothetical protein [Streptomyces sp. NBC_01275]MCX4766657.1 hypothetical protein [Streptomyces sp. NBC_01275]